MTIKLDLEVYEVCSYEYDENGDTTECVDNEYVVVNRCDDLRALAYEYYPQPVGHKVEIYYARWADLSVSYNQRSGTAEVEVQEADCATGGNGSPVYEAWYDKMGNEVTQEEIQDEDNN